MILLIDWAQLGGSHSGLSPAWCEAGTRWSHRKVFFTHVSDTGTRKVQTAGGGAAGAPPTLSSYGLSLWSLQHGGLRAAMLITWPRRDPQAYVLSERTEWKLYHLFRPSPESHSTTFF